MGGREPAALKSCRIGMVKAVFALCGSLNATRVIETFSTLMISSVMGSFAFTILRFTCVSNAPEILLRFVVVPALEVARWTLSLMLSS